MFKAYLKTLIRNQSAVLFGMLFPLGFVLIYVFAIGGSLSDHAHLEPAPVIVELTGNEEEETFFKKMLEPVFEEKETAEEVKTAPRGEKLLVGKIVSPGEEASKLVQKSQAVGKLSIKMEDHRVKFAFQIAQGREKDFQPSLAYQVLKNLNQMNQTLQVSLDKMIASKASDRDFEAFWEQVKAISNDSVPGLASLETKKGISKGAASFYACMAYICLYFMCFGATLYSGTEADQSLVALRELASPKTKWKRVVTQGGLYSLVALLVTYLSAGLMTFYGIPLSRYVGELGLLLTLGVLLGISLGMAMGVLLPVGEKHLMAIAISVPLILGSLSGLMIPNVRLWVVEQWPLVAKWNPLALIGDALYQLNAYEDLGFFYENVRRLLMMLMISWGIIGFGTRRLSYEHL